jgi:hypothetical protein
MKTPRITDFDPDAKTPTLKSSLDSMPSIQKPQPANSINSHKSAPSLPAQAKPKPEPKTSNPQKPLPQPGKRSYIRRTFDFYDDQITYLSRKSLQGKLDGKEISMNEMVREAIDDWINKNPSGK